MSRTIDSWFRVKCSDCGAAHSWPNIGTEDYPGTWRSARLTCPRCKNRQRAQPDFTSQGSMPTPQELLALAEKYENSDPTLARIVVEQLQKGAHAEAKPKAEAPQNNDSWGEW